MCVCVCVCVCVCLVTQLCLTLCHPMDRSLAGSSVHGNSPGKNTGVDCSALLQGIFPTKGSNPSLPHCRWILYCLRHQGRPTMWVSFIQTVEGPNRRQKLTLSWVRKNSSFLIGWDIGVFLPSDLNWNTGSFWVLSWLLYGNYTVWCSNSQVFRLKLELDHWLSWASSLSTHRIDSGTRQPLCLYKILLCNLSLPSSLISIKLPQEVGTGDKIEVQINEAEYTTQK